MLTETHKRLCLQKPFIIFTTLEGSFHYERGMGYSLIFLLCLAHASIFKREKINKRNEKYSIPRS